jgi:hypothetical protein
MEKHISLHQFYFDAMIRGSYNRERLGQAHMNHLYEVRPDLAVQVFASECDPITVTKLKDPRWKAFIHFIETNWYKE